MAFQRASELAGKYVTRALSILLNEKHLYQHSDIDSQRLKQALEESARQLRAAASMSSRSSFEDFVEQEFRKVREPWWVCDLDGFERLPVKDFIKFNFPDVVRSHCANCDATEPFNPFGEHSDTGANRPTMFLKRSPTTQVFTFLLQCQGCKGTPIAFLVKRETTRLTLVGRSEIEHLEVPPEIPKEERKLFSDAVLAYQCGQILPALFMLRTVIEQHMRRITGITDPRKGGDRLWKAYKSQIDARVARSSPPLDAIYGHLSDALHRADSNSELFERSRREIEAHFQLKSGFLKFGPIDLCII